MALWTRVCVADLEKISVCSSKMNQLQTAVRRTFSCVSSSSLSRSVPQLQKIHRGIGFNGKIEGFFFVLILASKIERKIQCFSWINLHSFIYHKSTLACQIISLYIKETCVTTAMQDMCNKILTSGEWPEEGIKSILILIPKNSSKKCTD